MIHQPIYLKMIERELSRRIKQNPRYSLRSFAKALKVDAGNLSRCMNGKASLSLATANKLANGLNLSPVERSEFLNSFMEKKSGMSATTEKEKFDELDLQAFDAIIDIHHYAIMELTFVKGFSEDPTWIAKKLGISRLEAGLAVQRLLNLGLLKKQRNTLVKTTQQILKTKPGKTTSTALRLHQKQVLNKALEAIDNNPIAKRCNVSMTLAINEEDIEYARQKIEEFSDQLCQRLSKGKRSKVYQLGISFYPLQED